MNLHAGPCVFLTSKKIAEVHEQRAVSSLEGSSLYSICEFEYQIGGSLLQEERGRETEKSSYDQYGVKAVGNLT